MPAPFCHARPSLSFPRNLSPTFVIGERESRDDAVHVHGVSSAIPPSSAMLPSAVILNEVKNLASRWHGHDAGGVGERIEYGHFFPSPQPSPSRGEGALTRRHATIFCHFGNNCQKVSVGA